MRLRAGLSVIVYAAVLLYGCSPGRDTFSDAEARAWIEKYFDTLREQSFVIGEIAFVVNGEDHSKGRVLANYLWAYEAMAKAGVLAITEERDLTKNFGGWSDFFALSQTGVRRTATTSLTDRGKAIGKRQPVGGFEQLTIPLFRFETQDIVANDVVPSAVDAYRLVLATYAYGDRREFAEFLESSRGSSYGSQDRKLKVFLKFGPFEKAWNLVAVDHGSKGTDAFESDRVDNVLQRLKIGA